MELQKMYTTICYYCFKKWKLWCKFLVANQSKRPIHRHQLKISRWCIWIELLKCGFDNKSFILNAPLVSCPNLVLHFRWVCCCTHPEGMTGTGQLTRGAFRINDLLWNPYFRIQFAATINILKNFSKKVYAPSYIWGKPTKMTRGFNSIWVLSKKIMVRRRHGNMCLVRHSPILGLRPYIGESFILLLGFRPVISIAFRVSCQ